MRQTRFNRAVYVQIIALAIVAFLLPVFLDFAASMFAYSALTGVCGSLAAWTQQFDEFGYRKNFSEDVDADE